MGKMGSVWVKLDRNQSKRANSHSFAAIKIHPQLIYSTNCAIKWKNFHTTRFNKTVYCGSCRHCRCYLMKPLYNIILAWAIGKFLWTYYGHHCGNHFENETHIFMDVLLITRKKAGWKLYTECKRMGEREKARDDESWNSKWIFLLLFFF